MFCITNGCLLSFNNELCLKVKRVAVNEIRAVSSKTVAAGGVSKILTSNFSTSKLFTVTCQTPQPKSRGAWLVGKNRDELNIWLDLMNIIKLSLQKRLSKTGMYYYMSTIDLENRPRLGYYSRLAAYPTKGSLIYPFNPWITCKLGVGKPDCLSSVWINP